MSLLLPPESTLDAPTMSQRQERTNRREQRMDPAQLRCFLYCCSRRTSQGDNSTTRTRDWDTALWGGSDRGWVLWVSKLRNTRRHGHMLRVAVGGKFSSRHVFDSHRLLGAESGEEMLAQGNEPSSRNRMARDSPKHESQFDPFHLGEVQPTRPERIILG